jgi:phenylalanyl-tRNA synthetase alpha subunit
MSISQIRQSLHEYIRFADEKKIKAVYTILEEDINENKEAWTSEFTKELLRRSKDFESGKVKIQNRTIVHKKIQAALGK